MALTQQYQEVVYVVTLTPERAKSLLKYIDLRGLDNLVQVPYDEALRLLSVKPPALMVLDTEGQVEKTATLMRDLPFPVPSIVLVDRFEEELFVICHDKGARDILVKPVPDVYLTSRILRGLEERRMQHQIRQRDQLLTNLGVYAPRSGVLTAQHFLRALKQEIDGSVDTANMGLVMVHMEGYEQPLPTELQNLLYGQVSAIIQSCCRSFDLVGEYGADKFAVLLSQAGTNGQQSLAKRLAERLNGLHVKNAQGFVKLQVRVGVAAYNGCQNYEEFLNRALSTLSEGAVSS